MNRCQVIWLATFVVLAAVAVYGLTAPAAQAFQPVAIAQTTSSVRVVFETPAPEPLSQSQPDAASRSGMVSPVVGLVVFLAAVPAFVGGVLVYRRRSLRP